MIQHKKTLQNGEQITIYKGNIIYTPSIDRIIVEENHYIFVSEGRIVDIKAELNEKDRQWPLIDFTDHLIIPSFVDLHVHGSQYDQIGLGLDYELIDWLNGYTFPNEKKFEDVEYATGVYTKFVEELIRVGTLRSCIYGTLHLESTKCLMKIMEEKNIGGYVGKVNMDQNSQSFLLEDWEQSINETEQWICNYKDAPLVKPIITPRFSPSCSVELLKGLGRLANKYNIPIQSHLSENRKEVAWVKELFPQCVHYTDTYDHYGLLRDAMTLMAHGIYLSEQECQRILDKNVMLVHCPDSNMNLTSGIMPVRRYLNKGIAIGLGSDVGGGSKLSMTSIIVSAIQNSKLLYLQTKEKPLQFHEAFYMATKGGGRFFGQVGSLEKGYYFDALIIDMRKDSFTVLSPLEQLARFIYRDASHCIIKRYCEGKEVNV